MLINDVLKKIKDFYSSDKCKSKNWLAEQAGISEFGLRNILDDNWNPHAKTIQKLETVVENHQEN